MAECQYSADSAPPFSPHFRQQVPGNAFGSNRSPMPWCGSVSRATSGMTSPLIG
jgi:hypothetical protein